MRWLLVEMWVYLGIAFILGMAAYRWVFGGGGGLSAEDIAAELASVRTRQAESESERRRLRARIAELTAQLDDVRREARSAEAEAHAARIELGEVKTAADVAVRAARREADARPSEAASTQLPEGEGVESPAEADGAADGVPGMETVSFMAALREGAPDDLTKIKGIGQKLESALNSHGVYYYRQIADWTDAEIAEMDAKLKFPGRIERDKWRPQARRLLGREDPPPAPPNDPSTSGVE